MAKLILSENMRILGEFALDKNCITIGRHADNDICINDRAISSHHCQILTILNDSFVEDLNSTNGTLINNKKVSKHALRNGDLILIGTHQLTYENGFAKADDSDGDKTLLIKPGQTITKGEKNNPHPVYHGASYPPEKNKKNALSEQIHSLQILNGTHKDKVFQLTRAMTTLGKPGQQVAAITKRSDGYAIIGVEKDVANRYPTVNDTPISTKSMYLSHGDIIQLNGVRMIFQSEDSSPAKLRES
ncbi:FHA domain-containing protein [Acidihalobacter ferrooxydans]|uniref:FHA domain-containing protein n=1 Tax=Acidihalobacter ferrooxydans TaxID=1765967 RepID=A0A1P8UEK7_9GAMM|nr:FHA domain-containing protein [Acidihalobacter ferrooxydans]APZ42219.1 hypothetical protein BW247_03190 [Acidihalobacter ferrooxydans]